MSGPESERGERDPAEAPAERERGLAVVDRRILEFAASQPLVLVEQVQTWVKLDESTALERLISLTAAGLLSHAPRLRHQLAAVQITRRGLQQVAPQLPEARIDLRRYWRDIGAAWLWLAAHAGVWGEAERVYSRRQMQAADQTQPPLNPAGNDAGWSTEILAKAADAAFALQLSSDTPDRATRAHYPDLTLVIPQGRVALELHAAPLPTSELEEILRAYAQKSNIAVIVYLVDNTAVREQVQAAAARLGVSDLVRVQPFQLDRTNR